MLRRLQVVSNKNADAMSKAAVKMVRGRFVQKDHVNKTAILPTSQESLYWIDKTAIPTGLMSLEGDLSDYDTRFETIEAGDFVVLEKAISGERYATTEFVATGLVVGDYLIVEVAAGNDQGKVKKNATATNLKYGGAFTDNGKTLAIVEVL